MKLIAGLGNSRRIYARNRHNIGFMCLNHFARARGIKFDGKQGRARTGTGEVCGNKVVVARPQTGMNLSGQSVSRLVSKFNISPKDLIVIHDDLDLPLGKIRISCGSTSGGHRGVDSIITHLGDSGFVRIRIGIGRPPETEVPAKDKEAGIINYVLSDFTPEENKVVNQAIPRASEAVLCLITGGLVAAMNKYN